MNYTYNDDGQVTSVMRLTMFFYDDKIKQYESLLDYDAILQYLESIVGINQNEIIPTIIGYAWYFCDEGDVNVQPKQYNYEFYLQTWKKYIDIGIEQYTGNAAFDFIAGYTLSLSGIYLDAFYGVNYEKKGIILMEKCLQISNGTLIGQLAENFLLNEKSKKYIYMENCKSICDQLFDKGSLLDSYFREIYIK